MRRNLVIALVVTLAACFARPAAPSVAASAVVATAQGTVCVGEQLADLNRLFDSEPAGIVGADYQRATALPDGRVFWTFQDGAIRTAPERIEVVHNIAAIQQAGCFTFLYGGTRSAPRPFLFADRTEPFRRWFWPLGAAVGRDGRLHVFTAEMVERGAAYLTLTEPVATRVAVVDLDTFSIEERTPADASAALYGWSVTSDDAWTYLYAHCYRQFGYDEFLGVPSHDLGCSTRITVARVPAGDLFARPQYWDGAGWQPDAARAAPVVTTAGRRVNANQVLWTGSRFVSVNKVGDWWGDTIEVSTSASPFGPFVVAGQVPAVPKCPECNTFFAGLVPVAAGSRAPRTLGFSLSHHRWDGRVSAFYRPTFDMVAVPTFLPAGGVFRVAVPLDAGVPALNVTAVAPQSDGFVTVYPCDRTRPTASNLNFRAGSTTAAAVLVRADASGGVCVYSSAATDLVVDVSGGLGSDFVPGPTPRRLVDTRRTAAVPAGGVLAVAVPGGEAVAVNVTAVRPTGAGFLTVFPCDEKLPLASNLNYVAGQNVANLAVVRPGSPGEVCVYTSAETDVVVDLAGAFGRGFVPQRVMTRLADTRDRAPIGAGEVFEVLVGDAVAAVLNVAAVRPSDAGFVTVFPCDQAPPTASNLNHRAGTNVANLVFVRPSDDGRVCIRPSSATHLVVDLAGAFGPGVEPEPAPVRLVDTRFLP